MKKIKTVNKLFPKSFESDLSLPEVDFIFDIKNSHNEPKIKLVDNKKGKNRNKLF